MAAAQIINNRYKVTALVDVILPTPAQDILVNNYDAQVVASRYYHSCVFAARLLGNPPASNEIITVDVDMPSAQYFIDTAYGIRRRMYDAIDRILDFIRRAKVAGYFPPDNPFSVLNKIAASSVARNRPIGQLVSAAEAPDELVNQIIENIESIVKLIAAEDAGKIDLEAQNQFTVNISSFGFSVMGLGGSSNALNELTKLLPDIDSAREQAARQSVALDFRKRVPRVLFTIEYTNEFGANDGTIICWKRMRDASSYIIRRRDIIEGYKQAVMSLDNENVNENNFKYFDYCKKWALSFYEGMTIDNVCIYLDQTVPPNSMSAYTIVAVQKKNDGGLSVFKSVSTQRNLTEKQRVAVRNLLNKSQGGQRNGKDVISPYPALSKVIYGDEKYDWILAGANIRESIERKDQRSITRGYSYLGAQLSFIFEQMDRNAFIVPLDMNLISSNINVGVSTYGISQTISQVLKDVGALYYFEGKEDPNGNNNFERIGVVPNTNKLIDSVFASIDPETATMNLSQFSYNMTKASSVNFAQTDFVQSLTQQSAGQNKDTGVTTRSTDNVTSSNAFMADSKVQSVFQETFSETVVDITTADGIGELVRAVRIYSDFGPTVGRITQINEADIDRLGKPAGPLVLEPEGIPGALRAPSGVDISGNNP